MKYLVLLSCFFSGLVGVAQIDAYLDGKYFLTPEGPIYETYLEVYTSTLVFSNKVDQEQKCAVEVIQILKQEDSIIQFFKEIVYSDAPDEQGFVENLMQVKRFPIHNNEIYQLEVSVRDINASLEAQTVERTVIAHFSQENVDISDFMFLTSFAETTEPNVLSKSGYDLLPLLNDFFTPEFDKVAYYFEIYNADKIFPEDKFLAKHFIRNKKTGAIAGNYLKQKIYEAAPIIPVLHYFDIQSLPTGDYEIVAEVRNKNNELIFDKSIEFSRLNLVADVDKTHLKDVTLEGTFVEDLPADSLDEFIYCLYPIVGDQENRIIDKQLKEFSDTMKRQFIYSFWYNMNQVEPEKNWLEYKKQVILAEKMFGTPVRRGYQTDRGRIYLKYGAPNTVDDRPNEPSSYPYQIWHYYKIGRFNNKKFVFYQPDLVTNDYMLLHSDLQGEIQNFKWQRDLNMRNTQTGNIDDANEGNYQHYGTNSNTLFQNP